MLRFLTIFNLSFLWSRRRLTFSVFNYLQIEEFLERVQPPWILKPRLMAGAIGIAKFWDKHELWNRIHSLGDQQSFFVLERFVPGGIFHVDSIWFQGELVYSIASAYGTPPFELTTQGGILALRSWSRGVKSIGF